MREIHVLDQTTIDKIAAGEVVERPSSVVKELVENAIDAGADRISVDIKDGGIRMIRISDNGGGIAADQVRKAFLRHATSKITSVNDLLTLKSMGFRGEALSSIAAVSRVELITKVADSLEATRYCIEGGRERLLEEVGAPDGTTIVVRDLFYNVPARAKFLKTAITEASRVGAFVEQLALANPEIGFHFIVNGQSRLTTTGSGNLKDTIYNIYGRDVAAELVPIDYEENGIRLGGFIARPAVSRGNRNFENYYVNGRYVKSRVVSIGIEEGYGTHLMQHQYPFTCLRIDLAGDGVDVNVHPTKMEVRFSDERAVMKAVSHAVSEALSREEMILKASLNPPEKQARPDKAAEKYAAPDIFERGARQSASGVHENENTPDILQAAAGQAAAGVRESAGAGQAAGVRDSSGAGKAAGVRENVGTAGAGASAAGGFESAGTGQAAAGGFESAGAGQAAAGVRESSGAGASAAGGYESANMAEGDIGRPEGQRYTYSARRPSSTTLREQMAMNYARRLERLAAEGAEAPGAEEGSIAPELTVNGSPVRNSGGAEKPWEGDDGEGTANEADRNAIAGRMAVSAGASDGFVAGSDVPDAADASSGNIAGSSVLGATDASSGNISGSDAAGSVDAPARYAPGDGPDQAYGTSHTGPAQTFGQTGPGQAYGSGQTVPGQAYGSGQTVPGQAYGRVQTVPGRADGSGLGQVNSNGLDQMNGSGLGQVNSNGLDQMNGSGPDARSASAKAPAMRQLSFLPEFLSPEAAPMRRIIGCAFDTYWIIEFGDRLFMIDQHAAHEKVLFTRFWKMYEQNSLTSQMISPPVVISLSMEEQALLDEYMEAFRRVGFEIEHFGGRDYKISAVPYTLSGMGARELFVELLGNLEVSDRFEDLDRYILKVATEACKAAVKGGDRLSMREAEALIDELFACGDPYHCPHGRPTIIAFTRTDLEKKFKRIV